MKKLIVSGVLCGVAALGTTQMALAEEVTTTTTTTSQSDMLSKIQELMKLIASLQEQINAAKGAIQELATDLDLGAKNDDVLKAQEILASDPTLFGVKPTGYFGPMTQEAIKKFQERYGLEVTGRLDEATRDVMKELRKERKEGRVPFGLIKSGEVKDRILARLHAKWDHDDEDDDMDDDDDEDNDDEDN
ncbi:MAG: peptidoglycan-binding domain-containing protein, partial [Patescibacteria group bacterium]